MRLQPYQAFEVEGDFEILASRKVVREVTNGITIDSSVVTADGDGKKILKKGYPVGKLANGKYGPYDSTKSNGQESPSVLIKETIDVTAGDHIVGGYEVAKVYADRLPVTVDATLKGKMPQIVFA
ncbi:hypothetical protein [Rossellomorea vietnamensis]|uniref:hypothetical protein n=1 Tax=Rossellomorea vietnamensis TaxID=218284 RepID=UPI000553112F|nr:hypothetical protein [Rossellomorea vietnamensis]